MPGSQIRCPVGAEQAWIVPRVLRISDKDAKHTFHNFDKKHVGYFTHKDVRRVFKGGGDHYKEFVARFDANNDGNVDWEEFRDTLDEFVQEKGELNIFERIYIIFSEPSSCMVAKIISITIMTLIIISTTSFVLETMPSTKVRKSSRECCETYTSHATDEYVSALTNSSSTCPCMPISDPTFMVVETICISVFTIEYLSRLFTAWAARFGNDFEIVLDIVKTHEDPPFLTQCATRTWSFVTNTMNLIDLFAILPYYIDLVDTGDGFALGFLRVLRLARVFRIFKMGKYNKGMQLFSKVMVNSSPALRLLSFFSLIGMIVFGALVFAFEQGEWAVTEEHPEGAFLRPDVNGDLKPSPFKSIPSCFWWVIVTQTTVGYGDSYPTTEPGKVVGSICMVSGVLVLALPITIIGANFANEYAKIQAEEAQERAKRIAQEGQANGDESLDGAEGSQSAALLSPGLAGISFRPADIIDYIRAALPGGKPGAKTEPQDEKQGGGDSAADKIRINGYMEPDASDLINGEVPADSQTTVDVISYSGGLEAAETGGEEGDDGVEVIRQRLRQGMARSEANIIGVVRAFVDSDRLPPVVGESILHEISAIMAKLDDEEFVAIDPDEVHAMLELSWHWIKRCEKDPTVVFRESHKQVLVRNLWEFAYSTIQEVDEDDIE